jgi:hypothetical protein
MGRFIPRLRSGFRLPSYRLFRRRGRCCAFLVVLGIDSAGIPPLYLRRFV